MVNRLIRRHGRAACCVFACSVTIHCAMHQKLSVKLPTWPAPKSPTSRIVLASFGNSNLVNNQSINRLDYDLLNPDTQKVRKMRIVYPCYMPARHPEIRARRAFETKVDPGTASKSALGFPSGRFLRDFSWFLPSTKELKCAIGVIHIPFFAPSEYILGRFPMFPRRGTPCR